MSHLRLSHICRRRMMRSLAFDRHGCDAVCHDRANEELLRSTLHNHMVCRKARIATTRCSCPILVWHTYIDDEGCVVLLVRVMVALV